MSAEAPNFLSEAASRLMEEISGYELMVEMARELEVDGARKVRLFRARIHDNLTTHRYLLAWDPEGNNEKQFEVATTADKVTLRYMFNLIEGVKEVEVPVWVARNREIFRIGIEGGVRSSRPWKSQAETRTRGFFGLGARVIKNNDWRELLWK